MFNLRDFIKSGFIKAIGKMPDYQIILNASGYMEKGVLTEGDLSDINESLIEYGNRVITEEHIAPEPTE